jgi:hypothetical protein
VDERLPHHKRWKGRAFQMDGTFGIYEEYELEEEEEIPLYYELCQDIGDLKEMSIFRKSREVAFDVPVDCKGTFLEQEEIHGVGQRHAELQ